MTFEDLIERSSRRWFIRPSADQIMVSALNELYEQSDLDGKHYKMRVSDGLAGVLYEAQWAKLVSVCAMLRSKGLTTFMLYSQGKEDVMPLREDDIVDLIAA